MTASSDAKGTVLVIEDDPDYSEFLSAVLRDHGYEVEVAMDGDEALERALSLRPRAITLDLLLPGRTGIALYRQFRSAEGVRNIPIVVVTAVGTERERLSVDRFFAGRSTPSPERVLQKPIEPDEIVRAVDDAIQIRAA